MNAVPKSSIMDRAGLSAEVLVQGARAATEVSASAGASPIDPEAVVLAKFN